MPIDESNTEVRFIDNTELYKSDPEKWIRAHTARERRAYPPGFVTEINEYMPATAGDYQTSFIWEPTGEEVTSSGMVARYTRKLLDIGEQPVKIVDFGGVGAKTVCEAAINMEEEIKEGKVDVTVTNFSGKPTLDELDQYKNVEGYDWFRDSFPQLEAVLTKGLVNFEVADILEFRDLMRDKPVHLMFLVNVFPFTVNYNDFLLKTVSQMLHQEYGTLVIGHSSMGVAMYHDAGTAWDLLRSGAKSLKDAGFQQKPERVFEREKDMTFTVFQALKAPAFRPGRVKFGY